MSKLRLLPMLALAIAVSTTSLAQVPVQAAHDHAKLLASPDPRLSPPTSGWSTISGAKVFEAGQMEAAPKYMAESSSSIHDVSRPTRRAQSNSFLEGRESRSRSRTRSRHRWSRSSPKAIVVMVFARELPDPKDPAVKYTTTWFDMFRIEGGKIAEHWDPAMRR
jgi:predicted SnoaL-like aldol condensation-catalyzing enzyme